MDRLHNVVDEVDRAFPGTPEPETEHVGDPSTDENCEWIERRGVRLLHSGRIISMTRMVALVMMAGTGPGCVLGPTALRASRSRYNEAIRSTTEEQLLLNLVRLQYRDAPFFLEVGSVSTQFAFTDSGTVRGTLNEGPNPTNPDVLAIGGDVGYEERPTVTFSPLQGRDFVDKMLSPTQPELVAVLARTGWRIDRVVRLVAESMNGLDNASGASGPTPDRAPNFESFGRVCDLFRELQVKGLLELGYETQVTTVSGPLPAERVSLSDVMDAIERGFHVETDEDGRFATLKSASKRLVWRIPEKAEGANEVAEIVQLLSLAPGERSYEIKLGRSAQAEGFETGNQARAIHFATRSLMGSLFYLAQAVEVPQAHRNRGLVTQTLDEAGDPFDWRRVTGSVLRVRVASMPPFRAAISVPYRGYWYYLDESDLNSKSTFMLLGQLFALQAGGAPSTAPVLTLPVGK